MAMTFLGQIVAERPRVDLRIGADVQQRDRRIGAERPARTRYSASLIAMPAPIVFWFQL
jgi:hypothetical protein